MKVPSTSNTMQVLGYLALGALLAWVFFDDAWRDIWILNKEIVMTNILKWAPVILLWSPLDNLMDKLWLGSKAEKWVLKRFGK